MFTGTERNLPAFQFEDISGLSSATHNPEDRTRIKTPHFMSSLHTIVLSSGRAFLNPSDHSRCCRHRRNRRRLFCPGCWRHRRRIRRREMVRARPRLAAENSCGAPTEEKTSLVFLPKPSPSMRSYTFAESYRYVLYQRCSICSYCIMIHTFFLKVYQHSIEKEY